MNVWVNKRMNSFLCEKYSWFIFSNIFLILYSNLKSCLNMFFTFYKYQVRIAVEYFLRWKKCWWLYSSNKSEVSIILRLNLFEVFWKRSSLSFYSKNIRLNYCYCYSSHAFTSAMSLLCSFVYFGSNQWISVNLFKVFFVSIF